jgi:putative Mg2+ transporter-C (MgtC) family protein
LVRKEISKRSPWFEFWKTAGSPPKKLGFIPNSGSISGMVLSGNEETALRLGAALLVGTILGLNRELHGKPAGLRTHALVSLGAALAVIMILRSPDGSLSADSNAVSRVIQGILTGVGFLGAGVILHDPNGHISGLTTAATIWICAVLGLVCGLGHWVALGTSIILIGISLIFGRPLERVAERLFKRHASSPPDRSV